LAKSCVSFLFAYVAHHSIENGFDIFYAHLYVVSTGEAQLSAGRDVASSRLVLKVLCHASDSSRVALTRLTDQSLQLDMLRAHSSSDVDTQQPKYPATVYTIKACPQSTVHSPHLFPKQDTLYPETATLYPEIADFVAENGNKISCFRI